MNLQNAAQNIVDQLIKNAGYWSDDKPVIHEENNSIRISWNGPPQWATNDDYWAFEEFASEIEAMTGQAPRYIAKINPYWTDPKGFYTEAYDSYSISVYKG